MKKGDIVKCIDGSWALTLKDGKMLGNGNIVTGKVYKILHADMKLPTDDAGVKSPVPNNIIMEDLDTHEILFSHDSFLRYQHRFPTVN